MKKSVLLGLVVILILSILAGCGKLPDDTLLSNGKQFEEKEQFLSAVSKYEKLVELYPNSPLCPEALYRAGIIQANILQDVETASKQFNHVVEKYADSEFAPQAQFMIGFIYANSKPDTAKAREAYKTFLKNYPEHELVPSVQWEMKYLGQDINEIPELMGAETMGEVQTNN